MGEYNKGKNNPMYGRKHTPETLEKMSGKKRTEECRKKLSKSKKGKNNHMYGMTGEKNPNFGRKCSEETKRKISKSRKGIYIGPNAPGWQGGIAHEPYCYSWPDISMFIKERDNYTCQNPDCRKNSIRMTTHHIDYNKKNCDPSNLITLCNSCNSRANFNRKRHTNFYQRIMNKTRVC